MGRPLDTARLGDHIDRLYRAACALTGNRVAADDLVQETYARVLAKPRMIKGEDDVGYLVRTMRNVFLDERRKVVRRADRPDGAGDDGAAGGVRRARAAGARRAARAAGVRERRCRRTSAT